MGTIGRKSSISHGHMNSFNSTSPASARNVPRRRGTGDSGNPMSPTNSRFFRDEPNTATPPPAILRRKTDIKDSSGDSKWEDKDKSFAERDSSFDISSPFGSLKRSTTNPVGAVGSNSPWSSNQGSAFGSMGVGAFGNFALGNVGSQGGTDKKPGFGSVRSESRFKNLLSKSSSEDIASSGNNKDKSSSGTGLDRLPEAEDDAPRDSAEEALRNRPSRSETNPFDERRSGSAALGGQEIGGIDQFGLSSFGMPGGTSALRDLVASSQPPSHAHHEPMSPTHTNPYQSPRGDRTADNGVVGTGDADNEGSDIQQHARLPNIGDLRDDSAHGSFGSMSRSGMISDIPAADRSQTSSVGANRGFPGLGGLGGLGSLGNSGGWPTTSATGTPTRERTAFGFGDPIFGPMSELQSPSNSALGGGGLFGSQTSLSNMGGGPRPSKLGSLFPPAMQEQMRNEQSHSKDEPGKPQGTCIYLLLHY